MKPLRSPRGLTLVELLVVIGILMTMLGLSAGVYWRMQKSFSEQGASARVDAVIRKVRASAVSTNSPGYVEIDTETRKVTPCGSRLVGFWHFEDSNSYGKSTGAHHDAILKGVELYNEGKIGRCVRLTPNGWVEIGSSSDFDMEDGGFLEAYIRPAENTFVGDNFIFFKNGSYSLNVALGGTLVAEVVTGKGVARLKAENYRLAPGRWTKVGFGWDTTSMRIFVDETIVAAGPGATAKDSTHPFLIGHDTASFVGLIDEVRALAVVRGSEADIGASYTITHTANPWTAIYFAGDGTLDPRYHPGPVSISLKQTKRVYTVSVSMLGETLRKEMEKEGDKERAGNAEPTLKIISPNGFDRLSGGKTATVSWNSSGDTEKVHIDLSTDGGNSYTRLIFGTPNDGSETVDIPNIPSKRCRVRVMGLSGFPSGASESDFTIVAK